MASAVDKNNTLPHQVYSQSRSIQKVSLSTDAVSLREQLAQLDRHTNIHSLKASLDNAVEQGLFPVRFSLEQLTLNGCNGRKSLTDLVFDVATGILLNSTATSTSTSTSTSTFTDSVRVESLIWLAKVEFTLFEQATLLVESLGTQPDSYRPFLSWSALKSDLTRSCQSSAVQTQVIPSSSMTAQRHHSESEVCATEFWGTSLTGMKPLSKEQARIKQAAVEVNTVFKRNKNELMRVIHRYFCSDLFPLMLSPKVLEHYDQSANIESIITKYIVDLKKYRVLGGNLRSGVQRSILWLCYVNKEQAFTLLKEIDLEKFYPAHFHQEVNSILFGIPQTEINAQQLCAQTAGLQLCEPNRFDLLPIAQFNKHMKNYYGVAVSIPYGLQGHPSSGVSPKYHELTQALVNLKQVHEQRDITRTVTSIKTAYQQGLFPLAIGEELLQTLPNQPLDIIIGAFVYSFKDFARWGSLRSGVMNAILWLGSINPSFAKSILMEFEIEKKFPQMFCDVMPRIKVAESKKSTSYTLNWFGKTVMLASGFQKLVLNNVELIKANIEFSQCLKGFLLSKNVWDVPIAQTGNEHYFFEKLIGIFQVNTKACRGFVEALDADKGSPNNQYLAQKLTALSKE